MASAGQARDDGGGVEPVGTLGVLRAVVWEVWRRGVGFPRDDLSIDRELDGDGRGPFVRQLLAEHAPSPVEELDGFVGPNNIVP